MKSGRSLRKFGSAARGVGAMRDEARVETAVVEFPSDLTPREIRVHVPAGALRSGTQVLPEFLRFALPRFRSEGM